MERSRSRSLRGRGLARAAIVLAFILIAVAAYAVEESVSVDVRWRVFPYQTLRLAGSSEEVTSVSYAFRAPSALERSRGYIEDENAFRFRMVSNTPWRLQVRWAHATGGRLPSVDVRQHGRSYAVLGDQPIVLCSGPNGAFDIGVDVRVAVEEPNAGAADGAALLVCTIMPD